MKRLTTLFLLLVLYPLIANAANVNVNCSQSGPAGKISNMLRVLDPSGPNTITVSGTCYDNLHISGFDRLSLIAKPGAVLADASAGQDYAVIFITDSRRVLIQGFTIMAGNAGVACYDASLCRFSGNTFQNALQRGVDIATSQVTFTGDTFKNNPGTGLYITGSNIVGTNLTFQGNGNGGVVASTSVLVGVSWSVHDNVGDGIFCSNTCHLQLITSQLYSNTFNGVDMVGLADLSFDNSTATGNGYGGVRLSTLVNAWFGGGQVTGNGQPDINCSEQYTVAGNLQSVSYGSTNCAPPVSAATAK